jgi:O-antigen/teichoic acid export membrane protein
VGGGEFSADVKAMMKYGLPAFTGNVFYGVWPYYLSTVLAAVASDTVIGYYQGATNFTVPISLLSGAAGSALFPAFTRLHGGQGDMPMALRLAVKYVGYVTIPIVFLLAATAKQLMVLLYGSSYAAGASYLVLLSLSASPVLIGLTVLPSFFNGISRTKLTLLMVGLGAAVLFTVAPVLAIGLEMGVDGVIYGLLLSNLTATLVGLCIFRKFFSAWIDLPAAASALVAGAVGFTLCYVLPNLTSDVLALLVKLVVFSLAYLTLAPLLRAVDRDDLEILGASLGEMPVLGRVFRLLLAYERLFVARQKDSRPASLATP